MDGDIISLIINPPFDNLISVLKILFIGVSLGLIAFIVLFLGRTHWLQFRVLQDLFEILTYKPFGTKKIMKQWMKIKEKLEGGLESEYKLAVIEADAVLDDILKKLGYNGETLGERLKQVNVDILPGIGQVLEAHQTRNNIVHDPDFRLSLDGVKKMISIYEKALTDLGVL